MVQLNRQKLDDPVNAELDHKSDRRFVRYYEEKSDTEATTARSLAMFDTVMAVRRNRGMESENVTVADIGCGPGAQSILWADRGCRVVGLDVNAEFIELAAQRAQTAGHEIDFRVGTAAKLPWPDSFVDVCLAPELLEHVPEWEASLSEFARILKPGGILYVNTSNRLCPVQNEFDLPLYSWYPRPLKRRCEKLAVTTRPHWANYATYPAVNWFTYYQLRNEFKKRGMHALDRLDLICEKGGSDKRVRAAQLMRTAPPLRFLAHCLTPYTRIVGIKTGLAGSA